MVPGLQLFSSIGQSYGVGVLNKVRKWEDSEIRRSVVREQLRFCSMCRNRDILPNFVKVKPPVNSRGAKEVALACGRRLLKCAIDHHHSNIHRLGKDIQFYRSSCDGILDSALFIAVRDKITCLSRAKADAKRRALELKFTRLADLNPLAPVRWVKNLSSRTLSDPEVGVLSKGLNFNVQGGVKTEEFLSAVEQGVNLMACSEEEKQDSRMRIVGSLSRTQQRPNLTTEEVKALSGLRRDRSIVILSSDKGRSTVVMDKEQYESKAATLLQDRHTYAVTTVDPTAKLQRKVEEELRKLRDKRLITDREWASMKPGDSTIPKFYGLPKVHKEGVPLRPIIAFGGSPTYALASALAKRLRPLVQNSTRMLKDSGDFVRRIHDIEILEGDVMVSFDIKSMFTSLPRDLVKQAVFSSLEESHSFLDNEKLSQSELLGLVSLCLDSTFFRFRDKIYHQQVGTPMGSPISVVLAEITIQRFEEEVLVSAPQSLRMWVRYVDDVFAVIKETDVEPFLTLLNERNSAIQFEMEREVDGQLPFLDVLVSRVGNSVSTKVYRKGTHTDRLLDFNSYHPLSHKRSVVRTLWTRAEKVCSTAAHLKEERGYLRKVFHDNGYPHRLIRRWTAPRKNNLSSPLQVVKRVTVPYVKGASEATERILRKNGVSVAHKPKNTLHGALTKVKDKEKPEEQAGVVYNVRCKDCDAHYVGETGKRLSSRVQEHQRAINRKDISSAIFKHCEEHRHEVDWQGAEVVYRDSRKSSRLFLEAWASDSTSINRCINLNPVYQASRERAAGLQASHRRGRTT